MALFLVREGKLDLDKSVLEYLPYLPAEYAPITIRHLLSHTHGLTDFYRVSDFENLPESKKKAMSSKDLLLFNAPSKFKFKPGEGWDYSLLGYLMLNEIF